MRSIVCVTGFLGAGKTSVLDHLLHRPDPPGRLACLVNEWSPVDVDGERLDLPADRLVTITGGSLFCRCRASSFIRHLGSLAGRSDIDCLLIETSGLADPSGLDRMTAETGLLTDCRRHCCCVVDPASLAKVLVTLPAAVAQLAAADLVLINHADHHPPDRIAATADLVARHAPTARQRVTSHGLVDWAEVTGGSRGRDEEPADQAPEPSACSRSVQVAADRTYADLVAACEGLPATTLWRAKGSLALADGCWQIDYAGGQWQRRPATANDCQGLVLIADAAAEGALFDLAAELARQR